MMEKQIFFSKRPQNNFEYMGMIAHPHFKFPIMKKLYNMLFLFINLFVLMACDPKRMDCFDPPCDAVDTLTNSNLDKNIIWQYRADSSQSFCSSMIPIQYMNTVLFSRESENPDGFLFFDKLTGKLVNSYFDPENLTWKTASRYLYKNICVITDWNNIYFLDLKNNTFLNKINLRDYYYDGQPRIGGFGEYVYIPVEKIGEPNQSYSNTWIRINVYTYEISEVMTIRDKGSFTAGFESLAFWIRPDGDTLMIFQNRQFDFPNHNRRIDLYAYNMSERRIAWKVDSFTITGNTSVHPIIIKGDKLFFQGSNEAFCFNCNDGSLIWNRYFPGESFFITNAILEKGIYVLKSETKLMIALDEATGSTVWENANAGTSSSNMVFYKDHVYYETGQNGLGVLRRLKISDGQEDWTYSSSNYPHYPNVSFGLGGIAIDPLTNYIYANDRVYHMCIRIPQ